MSAYVLISGFYLLLVLTSGRVINFILQSVSNNTLEQAADTDAENEKQKIQRIRIGSIIGKCENVLILTFLLLDAYTALALVVTAKTIVRKEEIEKNSMFFLAGTMINVAYSVLAGLILKILLIQLEFNLHT